MTKEKTTKNQKGNTNLADDIAGQLEHVFLAGLGALSTTRNAGGKAFDSLVEQGVAFRSEATDKTEALIGNVQEAIRGMTDEAQEKASGLLDQIRDTPQIDKLQSVFDARVAGALERLGVASKHSVTELNAKLDSVLASIDKDGAPIAKRSRKVAKKKTAKKRTSSKSA